MKIRFSQDNMISFIEIIISLRMSTNNNNLSSKIEKIVHSQNSQQSLECCSTEELRNMLKHLEGQHDMMEAKNDELATHISDMRAVVKHVENEKNEELQYVLQKKKRLQDEIERSKAALEIANSSKNTMYSDMLAFKDLSE